MLVPDRRLASMPPSLRDLPSRAAAGAVKTAKIAATAGISVVGLGILGVWALGRMLLRPFRQSDTELPMNQWFWEKVTIAMNAGGIDPRQVQREVQRRVEGHPALAKALGSNIECNITSLETLKADNHNHVFKAIYDVEGDTGRGELFLMAKRVESTETVYEQFLVVMSDGTEYDLTIAPPPKPKGPSEPSIIEAEFHDKR